MTYLGPNPGQTRMQPDLKSTPLFNEDLGSAKASQLGLVLGFLLEALLLA